ncbi:hypothetical protein L1987_77692 [Smallanthus sonchifolius]|uniref:Uncharacterized protein n=1 Tax=Smallanthus sonchifolius TaxID=185202 RepID=A0ACB8ZAU7_9ASTR|nr:hypothetical protein L1987_77692 [Smallanthus sonchifolius]
MQIMKRKKASLEPVFTYYCTKFVYMFGVKALLIHVVSYMNKVLFVMSVDEETIPDPHKLCDDLEESLRNIKASAQSLKSHNVE